MALPSDSELHDLVKRIVRNTLAEEEGLRTLQPVASPLPESFPAQAEKEDLSPDKVIALGADHGGFALKQALKASLIDLDYPVVDCGTYSDASVDYPDFAHAVAAMVSEGKAWRGIIVDGAGIGSCMVANKVPGVRAALCYDYATAVNSREHNDANVLTLGAGLIGENLARQIVITWLETRFGGDRHARRVEKIMNIEKRYLRARE